MEGNPGGVRVFDGTTDFRVWRARVENELMRYHLLGYVMVRGYDGSQSFTFNGEEVPPRTPAISVDDAQQLAVKDESLGGRSASTQQSRLSRWDVLGESAEAKSILQRFLHPDVEAAILNKNIYDSWEMLYALYGNRSNPGANDVFAMHRVLHHIRLGDKKGETATEFITRWEMLMQQYALATGIQLTDAFRSVSLTQTLPSAWGSTVATWRGIRPFVPFAELVEKVVTTRHTETANASNASGVKSTNSSISSPIDVQVSQLPERADNIEAVKPVTQSIERAREKTVDNASTKSSKQITSKTVTKPADKPTEKRAAEPPNANGKPSTSSKVVSPPINVDNTIDLTSGEASTSNTRQAKTLTSSHSRDSRKKSPREQAEEVDTPRSSKITRTGDVRHEKSDTYDKRHAYGKYDNYNRFDKHRGRYDKNFDDRIDSSGPLSCFYCLKVGHHLKRCWYLKADIENGTTHNAHHKFSCTVTLDRNEFMVSCLEAYIDEVNQERARYGAPGQRTPTSRNYGDYAVADSVGRKYSPQQQQESLPKGPSPSHSFQQQSSATTDYCKRSHSVFQTTEGHISSRDPHLNRSHSVYRSTEVAEDFSPRKRARAPSFERQLQSYY
ncbi:hypothetical protein P3T76_012883 [Phytophthora citrophthora]|uniref:CCHC-type domain-containing protein n=1 Tax=Phytophthora citrophthora TaxID=4793 RepID=A0AAD9LDQ9_9STRA|nr:hypothetical protein P3T76_012883 [Phytophthora citrophthora]